MRPTVKLSIFFSIFVILFALFGSVINNQLIHLAEMVENLHDHPTAVIRSSLTAAKDVAKVSRNINEFLLIDDKATREREINSLVFYEKNISRELELVEARIIGDEAKTLLDATKAALNDWLPVRNKIIDLAEEGQLDKANAIMRSEGDNKISAIDAAITKIANYAVGQGMSFHAEGIQDLKKAKIILLVAGIMLVLLFLSVAVVVAQSLLKPQHAVRDFLIKATENGLNIKTVLPENEGGTMREPLVKLLSLFEGQIKPVLKKAQDTQKLITSIVSEREGTAKINKDLENQSEKLRKQSANLSDSINPILDTITTFSAAAKQIENDLNILKQLISSQLLRLNSLEKSSDIKASIAELENQEKSIFNYVKESSTLLNQSSSLSLEIVKFLREIENLAQYQLGLSNVSAELRNNLNIIMRQLEKINASVGLISTSLSDSPETSKQE